MKKARLSKAEARILEQCWTLGACSVRAQLRSKTTKATRREKRLSSNGRNRTISSNSRKRTISRNGRKSYQLQGRYIAYLRQLPKAERQKFQRIAAGEGRERAIQLMRKHLDK